MSFKQGQIVRTTRTVNFGKNSKIPKNVRGKVLRSAGFVSPKCEVEFVHKDYGRVVITAPAGNFQAVYSF